jgi:hypothetical protein
LQRVLASIHLPIVVEARHSTEMLPVYRVRYRTSLCACVGVTRSLPLAVLRGATDLFLGWGIFTPLWGEMSNSAEIGRYLRRRSEEREKS